MSRKLTLTMVILTMVFLTIPCFATPLEYDIPQSSSTEFKVTEDDVLIFNIPQNLVDYSSHAGTTVNFSLYSTVKVSESTSYPAHFISSNGRQIEISKPFLEGNSYYNLTIKLTYRYQYGMSFQFDEITQTKYIKLRKIELSDTSQYQAALKAQQDNDQQNEERANSSGSSHVEEALDELNIIPIEDLTAGYDTIFQAFSVERDDLAILTFPAVTIPALPGSPATQISVPYQINLSDIFYRIPTVLQVLIRSITGLGLLYFIVRQVMGIIQIIFAPKED